MAEIVVGVLIVFGSWTGLFFILRMIINRQKQTEDNMENFITNKEFEAHQNHCKSEFAHLSNSLKRGEHRFDKIEEKIDGMRGELKSVSDGVIILLDRAKQHRKEDE